MNLEDKVALIQTCDDFIAFLGELLRDLHTKPGEWENPTLEAYLEAMAAWVEDVSGSNVNQGFSMPLHPSWKTLGEILLASKYYE